MLIIQCAVFTLFCLFMVLWGIVGVPLDLLGVSNPLGRSLPLTLCICSVGMVVVGVKIVSRIVYKIYASRVSSKAYADAKKRVELEENVAQRNSALWESSDVGARRILRIGDADFAFRFCPRGSLTSNGSVDEGFWICETPTTQAQWKTTGGKKDKACKFKGDNLPVENVCWNECVAYVKKLNRLGATPEGWRFDLPTEEQWKRACLLDSTDGAPLDEFAWHKANSERRTREVGAKKPNALGVYDMLGDVWEHTKSKSGNFICSKVALGGGWRDVAENCQATSRRKITRTKACADLGLRLVLVRCESK